MVCRRCGKEVEPGDRFCRSCGTPVRKGKQNPKSRVIKMI
ncbi:MAG: zinc-ribbon domain-containing protein [Frisingicoccus sp.]